MKPSTRDFILTMLEQEINDRIHARQLAIEHVGAMNPQIANYEMAIERIEMVKQDFLEGT